MRTSAVWCQQATRLVLYTRSQCSLCEEAKRKVRNVGNLRQFDYSEVDVMATGQQQWKNAYEFDVPVIHVQRIFYTYAKPDMVTEIGKLMHHFSETNIQKLLEDAEKHA